MTELNIGGNTPLGGANFGYKGDFPITIPPCHGTLIKISKKKFLSYHINKEGKATHEVINAE